MEAKRTYTAFAGYKRIASGDLHTTLLATKEYLDRKGADPVLVFDDVTGKQIDFNFQGTPEDVLANLASHPLFAEGEKPARTQRSGPGRPKLGVICREVSLLPRHWDWLEEQPGGISVSLRKLVEEAKRKSAGDETLAARTASSKFMWNIAGNLPGFEEASRALFAGEAKRFEELIRDWPEDIRDHLQKMVGRVSGCD